MKTAKILKLTIDSRDWQYGKMYSHKMELDNWETIKLNKKKDNSFKVWDTVSYEENWDGKWKEVKEEKPYQPKQFSQELQNRGAMVWMSVKLAFERVYQTEKDLEKAKKLSKEIFDIAMELYNWGTSESKIEDSTENDDLPF